MVAKVVTRCLGVELNMEFSIDELLTISEVTSNVEPVAFRNLIRLFEKKSREFPGTREQWNEELNRTLNELENIRIVKDY